VIEISIVSLNFRKMKFLASYLAFFDANFLTKKLTIFWHHKISNLQLLFLLPRHYDTGWGLWPFKKNLGSNPKGPAQTPIYKLLSKCQSYDATWRIQARSDFAFCQLTMVLVFKCEFNVLITRCGTERLELWLIIDNCQ